MKPSPGRHRRRLLLPVLLVTLAVTGSRAQVAAPLPEGSVVPTDAGQAAAPLAAGAPGAAAPVESALPQPTAPAVTGPNPLALAPAAAPASAGAAPPSAPIITTTGNQGPVTLNLNNADIRALISAVSDMTGRSFVVDPRVQGQVTVISQGPMDRATLYEVFLSVLKVHGFAAVTSGRVVKIVPDAVAKQDATPVADGRLPPDESLVTLVVPLQNVDAPSVIAAIQPFVPPTGHLTAHPEGKLIILSDTAANADRTLELIRRIDQAVNREIEVVRLQYAQAQELATVLTGLSAAAPDAAAQAPAIIADTRTNSLLFGGSRQRRLELRALISHLDTPIERVGSTEVIYLRYAVAEDLAAILRNAGSTPAEGTTAAAQPAAAPAAPSGGPLDPSVQILADPATNALIIKAGPDRMREFKNIIRQLDVRRAQVFVEGVIAEVSDNAARELGLQWRSSASRDDGRIFGGTTFSGTQAGSIDAFPGNPVSLGTGLALGFYSGGTVRALLRALAADTFSNILSTPTLVTLDNEEAEIVVGQNVPFVTGQFTNQSTTPDNPFQTIQRQDVGILLRVKPQINEGDSVKLTLSQEVSSVVPGTTGPDLTTNKRSIKTNVLADDGQVIVIGGLIQNDARESVQKVPLLGDLPLLGNLFRNKRTDNIRTNLMVFLQPHIIRDARSSSNLTASKYDYIRARQQAGSGDDISLLPSPKGAVLPPIEDRSTTAAPTALPPPAGGAAP